MYVQFHFPSLFMLTIAQDNVEYTWFPGIPPTNAIIYFAIY